MKRRDFPDEMESLISETSVQWGKSKEEVWLELEKKLDMKPETRTVNITRSWLKIAAAATIALLTGLSAVTWFYTRTIDVPAGRHAEVLLPDNSQVKLNAESTLSYKPLLWLFSRRVELEGEAFFEVTKGTSFEVVSEAGLTSVLGTSFNVYARDNEYQVTCLTGKVRVTETANMSEIIITAGMQARLSENGILETKSLTDAGQTVAWVDNKLSFTSTPLVKVFEEISRQYNVLIDFSGNIENIYTGTFIRDDSIENVLNLVCRPFDLKATRISEDEYFITGNK